MSKDLSRREKGKRKAESGGVFAKSGGDFAKSGGVFTDGVSPSDPHLFSWQQMGFPHLTASFSRQERGFPPLFPQLFKRREKVEG
jgi:hypothetical protein